MHNLRPAEIPSAIHLDLSLDDWSTANALLTPSEKPNRSRLRHYYKVAIDAMFATDTAQAQVAVRRTQELSVHGERIEMWPAGGAQAWLVQGAVLDTGNSARTMVSQTTAAHAGLVPDPGVTVTIRGVNGVEEYHTARASVRIRGVTQNVRVAIGGTTPLLVGLDIIEGLFDSGFVLSRAAAEARAAAAAQQAAMGA